MSTLIIELDENWDWTLNPTAENAFCLNQAVLASLREVKYDYYFSPQTGIDIDLLQDKNSFDNNVLTILRTHPNVLNVESFDSQFVGKTIVIKASYYTNDGTLQNFSNIYG